MGDFFLFAMEQKLQEEYASLSQEAKDFLASDEHKNNCKVIYEKAGGPLTREKVTAIRESFSTFVLPQVSEETRSKLSVSQEQKDQVWTRLSNGADTIDLPTFIKLTNGIYTHALAQGID